MHLILDFSDQYGSSKFKHLDDLSIQAVECHTEFSFIPKHLTCVAFPTYLKIDVWCQFLFRILYTAAK